MSSWNAVVKTADGECAEIDVYSEQVVPIRFGSIYGDYVCWLEPHQARALAAQLIAAADHAEGVANG